MTPTAEAVCPYCRSGFESEDEARPCPVCGTLHHADCFAENDGCTIFGCTGAPSDEAKITLTPGDLRPPAPAAASGSFYNLNAAPAAAVSVTTPPPPRLYGSPEPPPLIAPYSPYAYASYVRPKSRVTFVLLAIFLGSFGLHNFYTGYTKKAAIQLCLTVLTCLWLSPVTWIWAIVEACTISVDDDGVLLQ